MSGALFTVVLLGDQDRAGFSCGVAALDRYFQTQVTQDASPPGSGLLRGDRDDDGLGGGLLHAVGGGSAVERGSPELARRLPRYPGVPVARMGRLAVDHRFKGRKLGAALLLNAAARAARSEVAVHALLVEAKDEAAEAFYRHHGFVPVAVPRQLMAPIATFRQLLES